MLPIHLKSEIGLTFRGLGLAMCIFLIVGACGLWQMSGAHVDGLSLSFPLGRSAVFGYPLAAFRPQDIALRLECVFLSVLFLGFAAWFFVLLFRSSVFWIVTEDHIERRTVRRGGDQIETWPMSDVVAAKLRVYNGRIRNFWNVKLKMQGGRWLRLPWIRNEAEAKALLEVIRSRIALR